MKIFVAILVCLLLGGGYCWKNSFHAGLSFRCPHDQGISWIKSQHHNWPTEDRRWDFHCRVIQGITVKSCSWSGYLNSFDGTFSFRCSGEGFIAGVGSTHSWWHKDRKYQFYCCRPGGTAQTNACYSTGYNSYDAEFTHTVPERHVVVGVNSHHSNWHEDRQFSFEFCKME